MGLKFIRKEAPPKLVKHLIHSNVAGMEKPRKHGTIHASELFKENEFCPREWAFLDLGVVKKKPEFIGTAMKMTFDHGRYIEKQIRNEYLRNKVLGQWNCGYCGHTQRKWGHVPVVQCDKCNRKDNWLYIEPRVMDPKTMVSGGIDFIVDLSDKLYRVTEVKTMDKDQHRDLKAPLAEHKQRTSLYLLLADLDQNPWGDMVNTKRASILYVSKSYGFKDTTLKDVGLSDSPFSPFKEFIVGRDDEAYDTVLNRAMALTTWRKMVEQEMAPGLPCGVCHNGLTKRAQKCSAVGPCFSGSYPGIITWCEDGEVKHKDKPILAER